MTQLPQGKAEPVPHPVADLLRRYVAVFRAAWSMRHQMAGPARLADEAAFLPAALSLQETPIHPAPRRLAWAIVALFLIALTWACFGEVDIVAAAPGRIVVSDNTKVVQPLETSVVQRILVKDGDEVQAGQVLVELDPTVAVADIGSIREQLAYADSERQRTAALLEALDGPGRAAIKPGEDRDPAARAQLDAEWQDIQARRAKLTAETQRRRAEVLTVQEAVGKLEATLPLAIKREADYNRLVEQGYISGHATQDKMRERIELERDLVTQRARLNEARMAVLESEQTAAAYIAETRRSLQDRHAQAASRFEQLSQDRTKAAQREKLTQLVAPVAGVVQQLAVHSVGGVVTEAQPLMVIVPRGAEVIAEVTLENKDIGFVRAGQEATIKMETFLYTRYGTVPATVKWVTPDAVNDEKRGAVFPARLALGQRRMDVDGKSIELAPGMSLTAEIKTGRRRVIEYLTSPIQKAAQESFHER